jgi:phosphohistidine phosphatase
MKQLLLLRHAKSSWGDMNLADHDRPLNKRGKQDAPRMGDLLRYEDIVPDLIVSSTAKRARTTAQIVADAAGYEGEVVLTRDLYHADASNYLEVARDFGADNQCIMLVGHNPGLENLVDDLAGSYERMPTAALAFFLLKLDAWADLDEDVDATLQAVWIPKALPHNL